MGLSGVFNTRKRPWGQTIQVYPNPTSGFITATSDCNIRSIDVLSFNGQIVYNNTNLDARTARINVSDLPSGVYLMKVTTTKDISTVKITVTH